MIEYHSDIQRLTPDHLFGFFADWPNPPSPDVHLRLLAGSSHFVVAQPRGSGRVVGYITALSDGVLSAYIPHLEVLSDQRGQGIGSQLVRAMLDRLGEIYMIDLMCDEDVQPFYERLGLKRSLGMSRRRYGSQAGL
jgi:ribosomal protein S18 acetylase RimI-like enzyme